ncbi:TRAP transporter small permease subunit [Roseibium alexandrii]|uniref:TRAP transporter small permease protein n=1 Tax=Roseibium alexandrii (strain DSM 17067 / NCIMB 14079 / DFL-11) TaxID=244592 RepID=A0A5E8H4U4_ROSAD|nr:TRAP transporter small permease subunit [Roseibium alexandrii]EEE46311.1 TRAP-type mannitol/chloroaromatic compound transport system, small permease component [Roseibium alexandrii DFL-11]
MPQLDFTLPHWAYWLGLILFPIVAATLAKRPKPKERKYSTVLGYFILITGGILGLHRLYLKSMIGLLYIPVFIVILFANSQGQDARSVTSDMSNLVRQAERTLDREGGRVTSAEAELPGMRQKLAEAETGSIAERRAQRDVRRAEQRIEQGRERMAAAEADLETGRPAAEEAQANLEFWQNIAKYAFWLILAGVAIDVFLLPGLVRKANANLPPEPELSEAEIKLKALEEAERKDDASYVSSGWTGWIDRLSLFCGEFVAYWAVIAVIVYYFEVMSRYVFGSPTNWAHEAMYLMFGMQYLIAGSYAMLTESHVRVDIFYAPLSKRRKAIVDLLTSVFFFIFAGTLLVTSWIFAFDAIAVPSGNSLISDWARGEIGFTEVITSWNLAQWTDPNIRWGEISFNEWEVPLWPMKMVMIIGGLLLVLQGVSKFAQDLRALVGRA